MDIVDKTLERLDYNENKINEALKDIKSMRQALVFDTSKYDLKKLLSDESYRYRIAITLSKTNKEACSLLNTTERTFYRKLKEYRLTNLLC